MEEQNHIDKALAFMESLERLHNQLKAAEEQQKLLLAHLLDLKKDGKTDLKINDYAKLRGLFGELLSEIQRIKSEGDYDAGRELVEKYAVKVDQSLHQEILNRYSKLDIAPYKGFVNPVYNPVYDNAGNITDVKIDYTEGYVDQMLRYARDYSPLTK